MSDESRNIRAVLLQATRILHHKDIIDGNGHVSVRNPSDPDTFFQKGGPAALIASPDDFVEYSIHDGTPLDGRKVSPYSEHHIHAAMYARFPDVQSVVHSHAGDVLPFTIAKNGLQLKAVIHTAGFLGEEVPVWDIAKFYTDGDTQDLLVNKYHLGKSLAAAADVSNDAASGTASTQHAASTRSSWHKVVLQRGHGFVAMGESIQEAVYNSIYAVENAKVLAMSLQAGSGRPEDLIFLTSAESDACTAFNKGSLAGVWPLWVKQMEKDNFWQ